MRRRLQHALALPLIAWGLLCLSGAAGLAALLRGMHATAVESAYREAEAAAATAEQALLRAFEMVASLQDLLRVKRSVLGWSYSIAGLELDHHLRRMTQDGRFGVVQLSMADAAGRMTWSSARPGPGSLTGAAAISLADRDHIRVHLSPEPVGTYVSAPLVGRVSGRWSIQVSEAIGRRGTAGDLPEGVGVVSLDPVRLSQALAAIAEGPGRRIVVRRLLDGAVLARSAEIEAYLPRPPAPDHPLVVAGREAPRGRLNHGSLGTGRPVIGAYRVPEDLPIAVAALFDREEELRPFRTMAIVILGATLVLAASGLQLALLWGRRRAAVRTLRVQAERDPLTGLRNRRAMTEAAGELLARPGPAGEPMAVLLFDLDHFKRINDVHGHEAGDAVLRDVAAALVGNVRRGDLVCRWGGEEILVLLRGCDRAGAAMRAEELRACVASLHAEGRGPVPGVTTSIGAAVFPRDGTSLDALVQAADRALYRAKREGRNRVRFAEPMPGQAAPAA